MANRAAPNDSYLDEDTDFVDGENEEELAPARSSSYRPRGAPRGGGPRRSDQRGRFRPRRKVCSFCVDKVKHFGYKDVDMLRRFVDDHGKIVPRRKTGTCAKHQRRLALAIKQARHLALLPFVAGRSPYN
jgi:small subunit ribosomal protein S18